MEIKNEEELRRIFSKNLSYYMSLQEKTQKEVADAINVIPTTFSSWVRGVSLPRMGKIEKLADYFGILKTDLIEEAPHDKVADKYSVETAHIINAVKNDEQLKRLVDYYLRLSNAQKNSVTNLIESMTEKDNP